MRTIQLTVYTYDELSPKAKEAALSHYHEMLSAGGDYTDNISEMFKQDLAEVGLTSLADKCYWSLGYCQGDGVAFYGSIDNDDLAKHNPEFADMLARWVGLNGDDASFWITVDGRYGHYHHWNTMWVCIDHDSRLDNADVLADEIRTWVTAYLQRLSRELEANGYAEIEHMNSEESFKDACDANGWEFYSDGSRA